MSVAAAITRRRRNRLLVILGAGVVLALALGLVALALDSRTNYFRTPAQIAAGEAQPGDRLRVGGLVKVDSVVKDGERVRFTVTDTGGDVVVNYVGLLPDLFREGQGIVVDGHLADDGTFAAETVLAKHDETYMPREVADALKAQGVWQGDGTPPLSAAKGAGE